MSVVKKYLILMVSLFLCCSDALATKCLKATTMEELKKDFPVIIRGTVISREKLSGNEDSYIIKIKIEKFIKGKLNKIELKATEVHFGRGFPRYYEIDKEYTFPVVIKGKKGSYEVVLPADGCPELPTN